MARQPKRTTSTPIDWQSIDQRIIAAVDVCAEYERIGVKIDGGAANQDGWLSVYAIDREEKNASAAINIGSDPALRGKYTDLGSGQRMSLYEAMSRHGDHVDWAAARADLVKRYKIDVKLPTAGDGRGKKKQGNPDDSIAWLPLNETSLQLWCRTPAGQRILPSALREAGVRVGKSPKQSSSPTYVLALPSWEPGSGRVVAWCGFNMQGGKIPSYKKDAGGNWHIDRWLKVKTFGGGSKGGYVIPRGLDHLAAASMVWKVEGAKDALALWSVMPPDEKKHTAVVANIGGSVEIPSQAQVEALRGKQVFVCHDRDDDGAGEKGAARWAECIAAVASECVVITLRDGEEVKSGYDIRDDIGFYHGVAVP